MPLRLSVIARIGCNTLLDRPAIDAFGQVWRPALLTQHDHRMHARRKLLAFNHDTDLRQA